MRTYGSSIASISCGDGIADGLSTTSIVPSVSCEPVLDVRRARDERQVVFAFEALAHDLHVQQAEEAAPEPEAERARRLGFVRERRVVEPQPFERLAQVGVLVALDGIQTAEHHRLRLAVAGERLGRGAAESVTVSPTFASPTSLIPAMR